MGFLRESSLVLYKTNIVDISVGLSSGVEFNFENVKTVIERFKKVEGAEFNHKNLVFLHTRSKEMGLGCSSRDMEFMKGLNLVFGFSVAFYTACYTGVWETQGYCIIPCDNGEGNKFPVLFVIDNPLELTEEIKRTLDLCSFVRAE